MVAAPINHITLDERGVAYIAGTRMKVRQIVSEKRGWGLTPEQIQEGHPHLSLAQVHAALSYYYDHQVEMDAEMDQVKQEVDELRACSPNPLTRESSRQRDRSSQR